MSEPESKSELTVTTSSLEHEVNQQSLPQSSGSCEPPAQADADDMEQETASPAAVPGVVPEPKTEAGMVPLAPQGEAGNGSGGVAVALGKIIALLD